jgi:hypothetical protein
MGFTVPLGLLLERWALTPPFHPYPAETGRFIFCCTGRQHFLADALPACTPARKRDYAASCSLEFGLSSPGSRPEAILCLPETECKLTVGRAGHKQEQVSLGQNSLLICFPASFLSWVFKTLKTGFFSNE